MKKIVTVVCSIISLIACQEKDAVTKAPGDIAPTSQTTLRVEDLRCEYLIDPLGVDTAQPRFSWKLIDEDHTRAQKQTAWQIVVTGDDGNGSPVLWDSGKVESGESANNVFAGVSLRSNQAARWKARAWDMNGIPTAWSSDVRFSMGLLEKSDWKGDWIRLAEADEVKHIWYRKNFEL